MRALRRVSRWVHVYAGLALSLLMFVLAATGGALVYKEAYWRWVYPELRVTLPQLDAKQHAEAIAAAQQQFGAELRSVKLPEPGVNAYHLYLQEGEAFLSAIDHSLIDRWQPHDRVMALFFDVHAHLMAGDAGERVGGVIGLLGVLMCVTGLILWWPTRRQFSLRNLVPHNFARRTLILWHRDLGTIAMPVLVLLLLSGSGLVFYTTAQRLLNGAFGDPVPAPSAPEPLATSARLPLADSAVIARVEAALPGARVVFYYPPREGTSFHEFRVKQTCELHPNGRSYVYVDGRGHVTTADACALPPGEKAVHAMYPLHAGKTESALYKFVAFLGAVVLAILSASGVVTYLKKVLRPAVQKQARASVSA